MSRTVEINNMTGIPPEYRDTAVNIVEFIEFSGPATIAEIAEYLSETCVHYDAYINQSMDFLMVAGFLEPGYVDNDILAYEVI